MMYNYTCIVLYFSPMCIKECMFVKFFIFTLFMTTLKYTCAYDLDRNPGRKLIIKFGLVKCNVYCNSAMWDFDLFLLLRRKAIAQSALTSYDKPYFHYYFHHEKIIVHLTFVRFWTCTLYTPFPFPSPFCTYIYASLLYLIHTIVQN